MIKEAIHVKILQQILKQTKYGRVELELPDGRVLSHGEGDSCVKLTIRKYRALEDILNKGDLGLAEGIIAGDIECEDTAALIEWACRNSDDLGRAMSGTWSGMVFAKLRHLMNGNSRSQAKKNIMSHYDLGNEFYSLWLDPSMTYSAALFADDSKDIYKAQMAKYDRIIDSLNIKPGDHILEIGCGWGGFFTRAVESKGCKVTAVMNSPEQCRYNTMKIKKHKMQNHVNLLQQDYRDIQGKFDHVVSIEMIESVGEKYWPDFFKKVGDALKPNGGALIQGITIKEEFFDSYRSSTDFIQQYIFPGGMLLTNETFARNGEQNGMKLVSTLEFGLNYAETLKIWRDNFNQQLPKVHAMGYDDTFVRMWNLYLSYCEGAFRAGRINVGQFHLQRYGV
ncbi:class I SAM-dependent methyltransferase [Bdellovibrio sp. HCB209]|uniref:class I SAM-dependent methyltransferase n=1 Tax=Bdellovibrio sp. HCB209 TaxID=3394354 RepID=UPI0039B3AF31